MAELTRYYDEGTMTHRSIVDVSKDDIDLLTEKLSERFEDGGTYLQHPKTDEEWLMVLVMIFGLQRERRESGATSQIESRPSA